MTKARPAEERREDLLAAARTLFVRQGISGTTLGEVTAAAGVSKGLFYLYFSSKEDLVLAMKEQFSSRFADDMQLAVVGVEDWAAKLDAIVEVLFEDFRDLRELHVVLFHHEDPEAPRGLTEGNRAVVVLRELLAEGMAVGAYRVEDPETTAILLFHAIHAFDPEPHGYVVPGDDAILDAAKSLFRRAAGVEPERVGRGAERSVLMGGRVRG
jgi:TetR/AcrR family transcriptional regulator, transcriptional repressor for nem operon